MVNPASHTSLGVGVTRYTACHTEAEAGCNFTNILKQKKKVLLFATCEQEEQSYMEAKSQSSASTAFSTEPEHCIKISN